MQDPAAPKPTRTLFKGRLKAPAKTPSPSSYTLAPVPNPNITVRSRADKRTTQEPTPISSAAVARPFVNPSVLENRKHSA
ncbi:hypothetical protein F5X96DRAFT_625996 [Biscogniauxia mediterranea]|nr:hypothetical protein F5X96DRAFT_625996 [Biscogniauxia mediterranea]